VGGGGLTSFIIRGEQAKEGEGGELQTGEGGEEARGSAIPQFAIRSYSSLP